MSAQRILLEGEILVGAQVVSPYPQVEGWATFDVERVGYAAGVDAVAVRTLVSSGPDRAGAWRPRPLDDGIALLATRGGEPVAMVRLEIRDGLVHALHSVVLPAAPPQG